MEPESATPPGGGSVTLDMIELNQHFVCVLCFGYFIDATTISDCLHTFCKSCIVNFLQTNHHCPHCDILLSRTSPLKSLRPDRVLQSLVYKTVPALFQNEMRRRIQFYQKNPHPDYEVDLEGVQNYIFNSEDSISLSIRYYNYKNGSNSDYSRVNGDLKSEPDMDGTEVPDIHAVRYFRCPATVPVAVLKSLIKTKYRIPEFLRVELLYGEECLLDTWTLMEVAYIFQWNRESPMDLTFQVLITRKVKRKRIRLVRKVRTLSTSSDDVFGRTSKDGSTNNIESLGPEEEPPHKKSKSNESTFPVSASEKPHHPEPLTPPETPETHLQTSLDNSSSSKGKLSLKIKRGVCPGKKSSKSKEPKIDYSIVSVDGRETKVSKKAPRITSPFHFEDETNEHDSGNILTPPSSHSPLKDSCTDDITKEQNIDTVDDEYCYPECDQDSESALEVDMSHETEPELENESETNATDKLNDDDKKMYEFDEEDQADSAIECNETSASEVMDSDDKDTDFNVSSESLDTESGLGSSKSSDGNSEEVKTQRMGEILGALDFSSHARSVRAQRKTSENSSSPTPQSSNNDRSVNDPIVSSSENAKPFNISDKLKELLPIGHNLLTRAGIPGRPPLPLDWVRPPLVGAPNVPQAAAFRDLVTLSHAAVQLQIAMAHAQAQAQVQAQTQKIQSQVQNNVLQNLKSSESLSFVNGSGDTLTISPILGSQGNPKPKQKSPKSKANNQSPKCPIKKPLPNGTPRNKVETLGATNSKNKILSNGNAIQNKGNLGLKTNVKNNLNYKPTLTTNKPPNKPYTGTSLKIPCVQLNAKQNGSKSDKRELDKESERTGDPVFEITNQKLTEFVRRQRINNKLNQNNNNNINLKSSNCNESITVKSTQPVINSPLPTQNSVMKPFAAIPPSSTTPNLINKVVNPVTKESFLHKTVTSTSVNITPKPKPINIQNTTKSLLNIPKTISPIVPKNTTPSLKIPISSVSTTSPSISNSSSEAILQNGKSSTSFVSKSLMNLSTPSSTPTNTVRTTNTNVRQIPNPSRLHQQSEHRISAGLGKISRIESLTRSLHEKVAASAALANNATVLNSLAR